MQVCESHLLLLPEDSERNGGAGAQPPSIEGNWQKAHLQGGTETESPLNCPQHPHPDGYLRPFLPLPYSSPEWLLTLTLTFLAELPEQVFGWLCRRKQMGSQRSLETAVPGPAPKPQRHQPITSSKSTQACPHPPALGPKGGGPHTCPSGEAGPLPSALGPLP